MKTFITYKFLLLIILSTVLNASCSQNASNLSIIGIKNHEVFTPDYIAYLNTLNGKYPSDANLKEEGSPLMKRIKNLVGEQRYMEFLDHSQLENPIIVENNWVVINWAMEHNASGLFFVVYVDTSEDLMYLLWDDDNVLTKESLHYFFYEKTRVPLSKRKLDESLEAILAMTN